MKCFCRYLFFSLIIISITYSSEAKEWKGIKPLFSTKTEVEKILGVPSETNRFRSIYNFDTEDIYIVFAEDDDSNYECVRQTKAGTVLLIKITPKKKLKLSDLETDLSKLRPLKPPVPTNFGYNSYIDEENGLIIRTLNGEVDQVNYIAATKDKKMCEEYYSKPEVFVQIMVSSQSKPKKGGKATGKRAISKSFKRKSRK